MSGHVDGNVLAGPLSEVFAIDVTTAAVQCAGCGDVSPLAEAMVYLKPRAYIVRCHLCDSVMLTIIQGSTTRLDLTGLTSLTF